MADYGIKISKDGSAVGDGLNNLVFHSSYPALKIFDKGTTTLSVTKDDSSATKEVTHSLGYIPMFDVYMQYYLYDQTASSKYRKTAFSVYHGLQEYTHYNAYADSSKLYIKFSQNGEMDEDATLSIRYYIYYDEQP